MSSSSNLLYGIGRMANPIQTYEPNLKGRDFVCGDIHGSFSVLANLLNNLQFDYENDRMFSVGDLVDRGPESQLCLSLINTDWFHPVLANHEQMMIHAIYGGRMGQYWIQNGGKWGLMAAAELHAQHGPISDEAKELGELIEIAQTLPYLITIKMEDGKKFHIIHAEMMPGVDTITDEYLEDEVNVFRQATKDVPGDAFCWSRNLFSSFRQVHLTKTPHEKLVRAALHNRSVKMFNDGLSHIISGHTIMTHPITVAGQTNIDTGAYASYPYEGNYGKVIEPPEWAALTCVELKTWKFYQATPTEFREVEPITITTQDIDKERFKSSVQPGQQ